VLIFCLAMLAAAAATFLLLAIGFLAPM